MCRLMAGASVFFVPVDLAGICANVDKIMEVVNRPEIKALSLSIASRSYSRCMVRTRMHWLRRSWVLGNMTSLVLGISAT